MQIILLIYANLLFCSLTNSYPKQRFTLWINTINVPLRHPSQQTQIDLNLPEVKKANGTEIMMEKKSFPNITSEQCRRELNKAYSIISKEKGEEGIISDMAKSKYVQSSKPFIGINAYSLTY